MVTVRSRKGAPPYVHTIDKARHADGNPRHAKHNPCCAESLRGWQSKYHVLIAAVGSRLTLEARVYLSLTRSLNFSARANDMDILRCARSPKPNAGKTPSCWRAWKASNNPLELSLALLSRSRRITCRRPCNNTVPKMVGICPLSGHGMAHGWKWWSASSRMVSPSLLFRTEGGGKGQVD